MNRLGIPHLVLDKVTISITDIDDGVMISFAGSIDMRDPAQEILPFLSRIHDQVRVAGISQIIADFTRLTFMNSSGIRCLISWIMKVNDLGPGNRYAMTMQYNPRITWQESSIRVLTKLFSEIISFVPVMTVEDRTNPL